MAKIQKPIAKPMQKTDAGKAPTRVVSKQSAKTKKALWNFPMSRQNFILAAIGLAVILVGYILMMTGITEQPAVINGKWNNVFAVQIAPFLLVIGYCVIIPYALYKFYPKDKENQ